MVTCVKLVLKDMSYRWCHGQICADMATPLWWVMMTAFSSGPLPNPQLCVRKINSGQKEAQHTSGLGTSRENALHLSSCLRFIIVLLRRRFKNCLFRTAQRSLSVLQQSQNYKLICDSVDRKPSNANNYKCRNHEYFDMREVYICWE